MNQVISELPLALSSVHSVPASRRPHHFHIPVMGIGFTIDTPLRVAHLGIESCISLVNDDVIEAARKTYCKRHLRPYQSIERKDEDSRARRITAYLNLVDELVQKELEHFRRTEFSDPSGIPRYFELLPEEHPDRQLFEATRALPAGPQRSAQEQQLRTRIFPGDIGVNIMTKLDGAKDEKGEPRGPNNSDALMALRGFAQSTLSGSLILSAGANPSLFAYLSEFDDFFPQQGRPPKKRIILKVSDFRSASVQGRMLSRRGLWISEYRIESGLNCGGHAFPTDGQLMGPILREFQQRREELSDGLLAAYQKGLAARGLQAPDTTPEVRITAQGGVGTVDEHRLLRDEYGIDSVGWGTPFLLVPEVVRLDTNTQEALSRANSKTVSLSHASPLGVRFWWLNDCDSEKARRERVDKGHPGSVCTARHLALNEEHGKVPLCLGSRAYQKRKIAELDATDPHYQAKVDRINSPACICVDLCGSFLQQVGEEDAPPAAVCPGPNIVNFDGPVSLEQMVGHIYGRGNVMNKPDRPHMFLREAELYLDVIDEELKQEVPELRAFNTKQLGKMLSNLKVCLEDYAHIVPLLAVQEATRFEQRRRTLIEAVVYRKQQLDQFEAEHSAA